MNLRDLFYPRPITQAKVGMKPQKILPAIVSPAGLKTRSSKCQRRYCALFHVVAGLLFQVRMPRPPRSTDVPQVAVALQPRRKGKTHFSFSCRHRNAGYLKTT